MENIQEVLNGSFTFKKYSSYKAEVEEFVNDLSEFMKFNIYEDFTHLLEENEYLREDEEGNLIPLQDIMPNSMEGEKVFSDFLEDKLYISDWNSLSLDDVGEAIIFSEAKADRETYVHLKKVSSIENELDLITFINEVIRDIGEVTHSTGVKNEYEVVKIHEEGVQDV